MFLRRLSAVVAAVSVVCAPAASAKTAETDLAVHLGAFGLTLPMVFYAVSVTNNGPDPITSATVVVKVDPRASSLGAPCTLDKPSATLTCQFGSLASGATATVRPSVHFDLRAPTRLDATATLTTSTPPDPNSANNSDSHSCYWDGRAGDPNSGRMWC
jgi:hypothetical protein